MDAATRSAMTTAAAQAPVFTKADRCDRCNAPAHMRALFAGGSLLFCEHHSREYHAALVDARAIIEND